MRAAKSGWLLGQWNLWALAICVVVGKAHGVADFQDCGTTTLFEGLLCVPKATVFCCFRQIACVFKKRGALASASC
jgi:hypothetical protein